MQGTSSSPPRSNAEFGTEVTPWRLPFVVVGTSLDLKMTMYSLKQREEQSVMAFKIEQASPVREQPITLCDVLGIGGPLRKGFLQNSRNRDGTPIVERPVGLSGPTRDGVDASFS